MVTRDPSWKYRDRWQTSIGVLAHRILGARSADLDTALALLEQRDRDLENELTRIQNPPTVMLGRDVVHIVPNTSATALGCTTELWDTHGMHTGNESVITIPHGYAGVWELGYQLQWATGGASSARTAWMQPVGTSDRYGFHQQFDSNDVGINGTSLMSLAAGAQVEVIGFQASGGNLNVIANSLRFWAVYKGGVPT
jgi:hypothetical protein